MNKSATAGDISFIRPISGTSELVCRRDSKNCILVEFQTASMALLKDACEFIRPWFAVSEDRYRLQCRMGNRKARRSKTEWQHEAAAIRPLPDRTDSGVDILVNGLSD